MSRFNITINWWLYYASNFIRSPFHFLLQLSTTVSLLFSLLYELETTFSNCFYFLRSGCGFDQTILFSSLNMFFLQLMLKTISCVVDHPKIQGPIGSTFPHLMTKVIIQLCWMPAIDYQLSTIHYRLLAIKCYWLSAKYVSLLSNIFLLDYFSMAITHSWLSQFLAVNNLCYFR